VTISIEELEAVAAVGWRAPEQGRLGDPGLPLTVAIDRVRDWYCERELPAMIAVPFPARRPDESALDGTLADAGWTLRPGAATVMTAIPGDVVSRAGAPPAVVDIDAVPDEAWLARYHYRGQALPPVALQLLTSAPWQAFGSVRYDGQTIAIGRVAVSGDWAGLTAIEVDPAYRRKGLGVAVTAALASAATAHGARHLYLQVEDDNVAARVLYQRIGFTDHHGYHYRMTPG
jgi:N-acetylglutamate synthase